MDYTKEELKNGGIYKISNVVNNRIYYGSTNCFYKRFYTHLKRLHAGSHANNFLQNDFNKCGYENFSIEIVEVVLDKQERLLREQYYIDNVYDEQEQCYNLKKFVSNDRLGSKNIHPTDSKIDKRCRTPAPEVTEKRVKSLKEFYEKHPELREQISKFVKNTKWKNHSANIILSNIKTNEEVHVTTSLRQFAIDRNISYRALHLMTRGKTKSTL